MIETSPQDSPILLQELANWCPALDRTSLVPLGASQKGRQHYLILVKQRPDHFHQRRQLRLIPQL